MIHFYRPHETPTAETRSIRPRNDLPGIIPVVTGQGGRGQGGRGRVGEAVLQGGRGSAGYSAQLQPLMWRAPGFPPNRGWRSARGNRGNDGSLRNQYPNNRYPVNHGAANGNRVWSNRDPR